MGKNLSPWGRQCKVQMVLLGKTLEDLSREINYSRVYISSIINGRQMAPYETVMAISNALQVDRELALQVTYDSKTGSGVK